MRIAIPYAFSGSDYGAPRSRQKVFGDEMVVDIPEHPEAPVAFRAFPMRDREMANPGGMVECKVIGGRAYEPVTSLDGLREASPDFLSDVEAVRMVRQPGKIHPASKAGRDHHFRRMDAERSVREAASELAFIEGVLHRVTAEPILVVGTTGLEFERRGRTHGGDCFRLDELHLALEHAERALKAPVDGQSLEEVLDAQERLACAKFEVVQGDLLAADFRWEGLRRAGQRLNSAVATALHLHSKTAVLGYDDLRTAMGKKAEDDTVQAMHALCDAFDDEGADAELASAIEDARGSLEVHRARQASSPDHDDVVLAIGLAGAP